MNIESGIDGLGELRGMMFSMVLHEDVQTPVRPSPVDIIMFLVHLEKVMREKYGYKNPPRSRCKAFIRDTVAIAYPMFAKAGGVYHSCQFNMPISSHMDEKLAFSLKGEWSRDAEMNAVVAVSFVPNNKLKGHLVSGTFDGVKPMSSVFPSVTLAEGWSKHELDKWVAELQLSMALLHLESHLLHFLKTGDECKWEGKLCAAPRTHGELTETIVAAMGVWWRKHWVQRLTARLTRQPLPQTDSGSIIPSNRRQRVTCENLVPPMDGSFNILLTQDSIAEFARAPEIPPVITEADVHRNFKKPKTTVCATPVSSPLVRRCEL